MKSQPQNSEFRINSEIFQPCKFYKTFKTASMTLVTGFKIKKRHSIYVIYV